MGGREVLDAKTMLDLLEGSASDGGPTVTIDVDVFKDNFGAPPPRRSSLSGGRRSSSSGASRRRETADPAQLKELLQACLLEGNDAAAAASPTSQPPRPAPRRSPRFAKPRRRMTCDPRLLNRLVMEHSGEIPTIPEETSATESLTSNPYRGGVLVLLWIFVRRRRAALLEGLEPRARREVADAAREVARRRVARQVAREPVGVQSTSSHRTSRVTDTRFERVTFRTGI